MMGLMKEEDLRWEGNGNGMDRMEWNVGGDACLDCLLFKHNTIFLVLIMQALDLLLNSDFYLSEYELPSLISCICYTFQ
jgi:hypothetical protein